MVWDGFLMVFQYFQGRRTVFLRFFDRFFWGPLPPRLGGVRLGGVWAAQNSPRGRNSTVQYCIALYGTVQNSTVLYSLLNGITVQYSTEQYCTVQSS